MRHIFLLSALTLVIPCFATVSNLHAAEDENGNEGSASHTAPIDEISNTIDEIVEVVESLPGDENKDERLEKLRTTIDVRFDFDEMARRSLGANWQNRTEEERAEFVEVFSDLLARTYLSRIDSIERGMVSINSQNVQYPRAIVRTTVTYRDDQFPIDYRMLNRGDGWKVYDVVIENIGLVVNYRNEFASIIRREQFSGLMKRLREKA